MRYLGGGVLLFKPIDSESFFDIGDVTDVILSNSIETAEAITFRHGKGIVAKKAIVKSDYSLKFTLTDLRATNLLKFFMGKSSIDSSGDMIIEAGDDIVYGHLRFINKPIAQSTREMVYDFYSVALEPEGDFNLLTPKEFGLISFNASIFKDGSNPLWEAKIKALQLGDISVPDNECYEYELPAVFNSITLGNNSCIRFY